MTPVLTHNADGGTLGIVAANSAAGIGVPFFSRRPNRAVMCGFSYGSGASGSRNGGRIRESGYANLSRPAHQIGVRRAGFVKSKLTEALMSKDLVFLSDNQALTTSNKISKIFAKAHKDIIRAIKCLEVPEEWRQRNFAPTFKTTPMPNGAVRKDPSYNITRDGFTILAMGFTGKKAMQFKIKYIEAFNAMERELQNKIASISPAETRKALPAPKPTPWSDLPFVSRKKGHSGYHFWNVENIRTNSPADYSRGRDFAMRAIRAAKRQNMPCLLGWIVADMDRENHGELETAFFGQIMREIDRAQFMES